MDEQRHTTFAANVLSADFTRLPEQIAQLDAAGIDAYHFDIMDGHFVPQFALSPPIMAALRKLTRTPFEAHLLVEQPERFITMTAEAGATAIIIHAEATVQLRRVVTQIRRAGCAVGVALNPSTLPDTLSYVLPDIDMIHLLCAEPGDMSQLFGDDMLSTISDVRDVIDSLGLRVTMSVEGGIDRATIGACAMAGAQNFVLGVRGLFGEADLANTLSVLRKSVEG